MAAVLLAVRKAMRAVLVAVGEMLVESEHVAAPRVAGVAAMLHVAARRQQRAGGAVPAAGGSG